MPRASTKVFKKRRGVFNKGRCNKSNDGCGESNSTVPKNSADEKIVLMVQSFVLMKLNHLPATRETCEHRMAEAVREAVDENDGKRDLAVAVDGSWQKRGFSSKNGLVTVTSVDTGKVIDVEVFQNIVFVRTKPSIFKIVKRNFEGWLAIRGANLKAELLWETYHHKNSLPVDVVEAMRPVFRDLANPELLKKCLHGGTQNPNESVNNVIWSRVPKKTFVQLEVWSLGTYDAVSSFNMGNVSKLEILRKMCIEPGDYTVQAMEYLDKQRLLRAKYYCLQKTKEVRKEKDLKGRKKMMSY
ncbi:uncharacterized protein TNCV_3076441 [Trichonephila clavipes]|nr:uncharacterized protein TNCV_3076441 [Trichonephila clavipes]